MFYRKDQVEFKKDLALFSQSQMDKWTNGPYDHL